MPDALEMTSTSIRIESLSERIGRMKFASPCLLAFVLVGILAPTLARADDEMAKQGYEFLKTYCYRCHGTEFKAPGLNVLDRDILVAGPAEEGTLPYLTPGDPSASQLWQRAGEDRDMPPEEAPDQPNDEQRAQFRKWIEEQAPFPARSHRTFIAEKDVQSAIRDHLKRTPAPKRRYMRYYTLTNLHNNRGVTDDELRLYRAALSKLINSLSWEPRLVLPEDINGQEIVYAIDVRDVGWDAGDRWKGILELYPYGLKYDRLPADPEMNAVAEEVAALSETDLPALRADWFIATASRPPLYHMLLDLPETAEELERDLKVNVRRDFTEDRLARAGFATSGVSSQNRLVDRHPAAYGAYWKSYDFKSNEGPHDIFHFPLGPAFPENHFPRQAFEQDGGELIFHLPNGLQGYLLIDGRGKRIDAGPIDVVSDALKTSGSPAIVNGLSCMACHKHGIIPFKDSLRAGLAVFGDAKRKSEDLIPPTDAMDQLIAQDQRRFLESLSELTGPYLQVGSDKSKRIEDFPEPIGAIARLYLKDLDAEEVASELGLEDVAQLKEVIRLNPALRELGMAPLVNDDSIKRQVWDSLVGFLSMYHRVASELELGTPHRTF